MERDSQRNELAEQIARAVAARLGGSDPRVGAVVAEEIAAALAAAVPATVDDRAGVRAVRPEGRSRLVVTSHGKNRPGIVARLSAAIDEFDGDIQDLSQTLVGEYFTMLFVVDVPDAGADGARFPRLRERLRQVGEEIGVHVVVMHDDILSAMHDI